MGIDIYMRWKGITEEEKKGQITGFSTEHGHAGYLREAYHGAPYATKILVPEAFDSETGEAQIESWVLETRMLPAMRAALARERTIYRNEKADVSAPAVQSIQNFILLAKQKEEETGEPVTIIASY